MSELSRIPVKVVRERLLEWFDAEQRRLPWRAGPGEAPDPYRVWLSEVMLQQTRVETVIPYFNRWIERFPDAQSLAGASTDEVLKAWEGLGYYSRARNLHRAVREVVERYGGRVPSDMDRFRALPGVGRYTAGAVMSIAFGNEAPVVDGNVRRVFARLLDEAEPAEPVLWDLAERMVAGERPGDLNQALMELGATVCTPRRTLCGACPVAEHCAARARGTVATRPLPRARKPLPTERYVAAILVRGDGRVAIRRRGPSGRLGGMWEFPSVQLGGAEDPFAAVARLALDLTGRPGDIGALAADVEHVFTHVRVVYTPVLVGQGDTFGAGTNVDAGTEATVQAGADELAWVPAVALGGYAMPRAQRRIAGVAVNAGWLAGQDGLDDAE